MKIHVFTIIEYALLLSMVTFYVIPHWNKREVISFTDIMMAEMFFFVFFDLYKRSKKKWKK